MGHGKRWAVAIALIGLLFGVECATAQSNQVTGTAATDPQHQRRPWASCWNSYLAGVEAPFELRASSGAKLTLRASEPVLVTLSGSKQVGKQAIAEKETIVVAGGWQMTLTEGDVLLLRDASVYKLAPRQVRLVPPEGTSAELNQTTTPRDDGKLPVGTTATITLEAGDTLQGVTLQAPSMLSPHTESDPADLLRAEKLPSATPANTLDVKLFKAGIGDAANASGLRACLQTLGFGGELPQEPVGAAIESVTTPSNGSAEVKVALPSALLPTFFDKGMVAVMLADGTFLGEDSFYLIGTIPAVVLTLAIGFLLYFAIQKAVLGRGGSLRGWLHWIVGSGGKPSLSLFQIFLWTWVVFLGCVFVAVLTGELLAISWQVLALVGIAGTGSVAARLVDTIQERSPAQSDVPKFTDIFRTDEKFDLYKLQMFMFTVFTGMFVLVRVVYDHAFPQLDENLLLLLGISNGIYVGSKAASGENPYRAAERLDVELKVLQEAKANADAEVTRLKNDVAQLTATIGAAAAGPEKDQVEADKKLREKQLKDAETKAGDLAKQIAEATEARKKAIEKL